MDVKKNISKRSNSSSRHQSTKRLKVIKNDSEDDKEKENNKSIVLKFGRLPHKSHHEPKHEIRKRKLKGGVNWEERLTQNAVENVINLSYSPSK